MDTYRRFHRIALASFGDKTMRDIVYLNGQFIPLKEASINVLDRGFLFGDAVYEVMPCFGGRIFRFAQHLQRLRASLAAVNIPFPAIDLAAVIAELQQRNNSDRDAIYCQITRGVDTERRLRFPDPIVPTVLIACTPVHPYTFAELRRGIRAVTIEDRRWNSCHIKATTLLPNVLMQNQALAAGAQEAVLVRHGYVSESCSSNTFIVKNHEIITPIKDHRILGGITREFLLELCQEAGFRCTERDITAAELREADEIWLSSSNKHMLAVVELDGLAVGSGQVGAVWEQIIMLYNQHTQALASETRATA